MANDDFAHSSDTNVDVAPVAKSEVAAEGRNPARVTDKDAASIGVRDIVRLIQMEAREIARIDDAPLAPLPTDVRVARLERRSQELEWCVYALLGLFFVAWLLRR